MTTIPARLLLILSLSTAPLAQQAIPPLAANSLAGSKVHLPEDLKTKVTFLILGFTQKSSDQAKAWSKALQPMNACPITWYQLPVLASAPGFIRPMILRSMRSDLSTDLQSRFVPITEKEEPWKHVADYQKGDDAYVLAVDTHGQILNKWHGPVSAALPDVKAFIEKSCQP